MPTASISPASSSSRRATPRTAISRPTRRWSTPRRRRRPARIRARSPSARRRPRRRCRTSSRAEVAGPGFINIRPEAGGLRAACCAPCSTRAPRFGAGVAGRGDRSTSNMSAPIRPGRCMSATRAARCSATRWPICSTFAGRAVTREYYINDAGAQVDVLARSAYLRYREALGEEIGAIPEGLYPGDYLKPRRRGAGARIRRGACATSRRRSGCRSSAARAIDAMMAMIRDDLAALNIVHEVFSSERALTGVDGGAGPGARGDRGSARRKGLVYEGRLPPPKGAPSEDWEDREQTLFRSTAFRRRRRPAADQVGRRLHLFRQRHRLSQDQDRPRLSRPWSTSGAPTTAATSSACRRRSRRCPTARPGSTCACASSCG